MKKNFKGTGADLFLSSEPAVIRAEEIPKELNINPVFQALIPPLSTEEYAQLKENLLENGIREPISVWNDTIIDGHNRYAIASECNLPYTTISYAFENEDDVKLWIFKNQMGRRNLPSYERVKLALHLKPVIVEKAKLQQVRKSENSVSQISAKQNPIDTRKVIADLAGVSHDTVSKVEKILNAGNHEILEKLQRGDVSINKAYQNTLSQEKNGHAISPPSTLITGTFSVIYADPPWESEMKDIKKLQIPASDNAILLLWSTDSVLDKALQIMNAWGFKYQTNMIWNKKQIGKGQYFHGQHETLLIGIRGNFNPPAEDVRVSSVYAEKSKNTKQKWFYEQIQKMFPNETYLDMFANNKYNDRWTVFKNQTEQKEID